MPIAGLVSSFLGGRAGDIQRNRLNRIAETPGLDIEALSGQALANQQANLPQAQQIARQDALGQQQLLNDLLEQSLPGFGAARTNVLSNANSLIAGEIPADISEAIQRSSAARALGGGYGGSGMHRNLVARDLGLTSLDLKGQGLGWLQALRGMSPMAQPQNALGLSGPHITDLLNIRGQERAQRMGLKSQAATIGGQTAAWANHFAQQEGQFNSMFNTALGAFLGGASGVPGGAR